MRFNGILIAGALLVFAAFAAEKPARGGGENIPVMVAGSHSAAMAAYIEANPSNPRSELTKFLLSRLDIAYGGFDVENIWQFRMVRTISAGQVVHLQYEVKTGRYDTEVREGDFVLRLRNGHLAVVDMLGDHG
jgi:hypothetical protein